MQLSHIGEFISKQLSNASEYNSEINVTLFIVMPNHIHAIVAICDTQNYYHDPCMVQRAPNSSCRDNPEEIRHVTILSRYINFLKGSVTKYARSMGSDFEWQPRYHDHKIRGHQDAKNITSYILCNVERWNEDQYST